MFKKLVLLTLVLLIAFGLSYGLWSILVKNRQSKPTSQTQTSNFNKAQYSTSDPASLWVIVNKQSPLPEAYQPSPLTVPNVALRTISTDSEMKLRADAAKATEEIINGAKDAGHDLVVVSAYRSYQAQKSIYNSAVRQDGQSEADKYSARPGHSEHQTGLAADFGSVDRSCELEACFGDTKAGKWLADNAANYGFVLRYPEGKQAIVGYNYEPWHFRFVGKELAAEVKKTNLSLEEFFGLPAAPDY